jgi:GNAT superfamily N-acetyltransferase
MPLARSCRAGRGNVRARGIKRMGVRLNLPAVKRLYADRSMTKPGSMPHLREATLADAGIVADLESAVTPDAPRDPELIAFWWANEPGADKAIRWLAERNGAAVMYVSARHGEWKENERRFGSIRVRIHPDQWSEASFVEGIELAEAWLRAEGTETSFTRVGEDLRRDLKVLAGVGYREVRRERVWQLDLVGGRTRLLATAEKTREEMNRHGVTMITLDRDTDPNTLQKLYTLDLEATEDIPTTVPHTAPTFEEWSKHWFDHPGHRKDRFWIARDGDQVVGMSIIGYPPRRGVPSTSFTGTARSVRGRGIARALKYQTVAQAIELGAKMVETANDAENAPILHLNEEMGYQPVAPWLELHRGLSA